MYVLIEGLLHSIVEYAEVKNTFTIKMRKFSQVSILVRKVYWVQIKEVPQSLRLLIVCFLEIEASQVMEVATKKWCVSCDT